MLVSWERGSLAAFGGGDILDRWPRMARRSRSVFLHQHAALKPALDVRLQQLERVQIERLASPDSSKIELHGDVLDPASRHKIRAGWQSA